jgi:hypothetical protein
MIIRILNFEEAWRPPGQAAEAWPDTALAQHLEFSYICIGAPELDGFIPKFSKPSLCG